MFQITLDGETMGTTYQIKYISEQTENAKNIKQAIDELLETVNVQMSTYRHDSQISQFNHSNETQTPFKITNDFGQVVQEAIRLNALTQGGLDITLGKLVDLYGFGASMPTALPTTKVIEQLLPAIGIDKFDLLSRDNQYYLLKHHPDVYLDLSSIAKGFGVDKVAYYFDEMGIENYLIEIGGEIKARGKNARSQDWQIAIQNATLTGYEAIIKLNNLALATSGNNKKFLETSTTGAQYCHILSPLTLQPIQSNIVSLTVIAKDSMTADGLATGLYCLGMEQALQIADNHHLAIFGIIKKSNYEYENVMSESFRQYLTQL